MASESDMIFKETLEHRPISQSIPFYMKVSPPVSPDLNCTHSTCNTDFVKLDKLFNKDGQPPSSTTSSIELPENIRHKFRSNVCDEVLSDNVKVQAVLDQIKEDRKPRIFLPHDPVAEFTLKGPPEYQSLSQTMRNNVIPGRNVTYHEGLARAVHNQKVFDQRSPCTDEYRCQKDSFTKWAECDVMRMRVDKAWARKFAEEKKPKE